MDTSTPLVDGFRLTERDEEAGSGEVWRARRTGGLGGERGDVVPGELPGVGECVLRLLRLPVDEAMRARARAVAADLLALDDPGLISVRSIERAYDGVALVFTEVPWPVLPLHVLGRRRQLAAGEIVTLGVAVAWGLAAGHAIGITHGRLRDADVLLDSGGRPRLCGMGVMGVLGAPGSPPDDVSGLARLLASLLDGASSGAARVLDVLEDRSVTAAELAARLAAATPAVAIDVSDPSVSDPHAEPVASPASLPAKGSRRVLRRLPGGPLAGRRARKAVMVGVTGLGVLLLAAVVGWVSVPKAAGGGTPPASRRAPPRLASPDLDWAAILTGLDTARAAAFARPGVLPLTAADAPGSSAYNYDASAVAMLTSRQLHAFGLRMVLDHVAVKTRTGRSVTLLVTDRRPAYDVRDSAGLLVSHVGARGAASHLIELHKVSAATEKQAAQWRIAKVSDQPAPAAASSGTPS